MNCSTVTERGQVSVPAELRRAMRLRAGQKLEWERVSDREMRVWLREESPPGPLSVLGYARRMRGGAPRLTKEWMHELRDGE